MHRAPFDRYWFSGRGDFICGCQMTDHASVSRVQRAAVVLSTTPPSRLLKKAARRRPATVIQLWLRRIGDGACAAATIERADRSGIGATRRDD